jgi:glycopeptide antibiotics resistance protein
MAKRKKWKGNSPSFFIGGIGCLLLAWLIIFFSYTLWTGFSEPGKLNSLFQGLTWQAADKTLPEFRLSFYILGAVTQAFVAGLVIMAVFNSLRRTIVSMKIAFGLLVILIIPFVQLWTRLGITPRYSFPGILLADAILAVSFIVGFVAFLSIRRKAKKSQ